MTAEPVSWLRAFTTSFVVLFAAEWGDLSQLLTAGLVAKGNNPVGVFIGSWLGPVPGLRRGRSARPGDPQAGTGVDRHVRRSGTLRGLRDHHRIHRPHVACVTSAWAVPGARLPPGTLGDARKTAD